LANEVTRAGTVSASTVGEASGNPDPANEQAGASTRMAPGFSAARLTTKRSQAMASEMALPLWPCLLPSIAVAVAPLRNLTGDSGQQYLVEAFTDDLVTDLMK